MEAKRDNKLTYICNIGQIKLPGISHGQSRGHGITTLSSAFARANVKNVVSDYSSHFRCSRSECYTGVTMVSILARSWRVAEIFASRTFERKEHRRMLRKMISTPSTKSWRLVRRPDSVPIQTQRPTCNQESTFFPTEKGISRILQNEFYISSNLKTTGVDNTSVACFRSLFIRSQRAVLKMSTKLLRRLLHQTNDVGVHLSGDEEKKNNKVQNPRQEDSQPLSKEETFDRHVENMLLLDTRMASRGSRKKESMQRISAEQKKEVSVRKQSSKMVLGNSRGSSSKLRLRPVRTSDKKKYKQEKEEKRLKVIAKLLKKQSMSRK